MIDDWRDVPRWEGLYQVNARGQVRSLDRTIVVYNAQGVLAERNYKGKLLSKWQLPNGYYMVNLTHPDMPREYRYVHELVALCFVGPRPEGTEVCHNDGTRINNEPGNLRYGTRADNAQDKVKHARARRVAGAALAGAIAVALSACQVDTNGYNYRRTAPDQPACHKEVRPGVFVFQPC